MNAKYLYLCRQGENIVCARRGHRTLRAAERCCARRNRALRAIGMLDDASRWTIERTT